MKSSDFVAYRDRYRTVMKNVLADVEQGRLDEAAFPAYSHPNRFISWLFWQRLRTVMNYLQDARVMIASLISAVEAG